MPVEAAPINSPVFGVDCPACVSCSEVCGGLAPLLWLRTLVGSEETEGGARGHRVLTACMLFPQVFRYDTTKRITLMSYMAKMTIDNTPTQTFC